MTPFKPFPLLETARLNLRQMRSTDRDMLFKARSDHEVMKHISRPMAHKIEDIDPVMQTIQDVYEKEDGISWFMELKETKVTIGMIGFYRIQKENFRGEIGYLMLPEFQGKGLMSEALKVILKYGFESMKFHSIFAVIDPANTSSRHLLLKNKFVQEGLFKENYFFEGRFLDSEYYGLLATDFL